MLLTPERRLLETLPVSDRALLAADPYRGSAGNEVCLRGWILGLLSLPWPEACELIDSLFLGFGRVAENGAGGEFAIFFGVESEDQVHKERV